MSETLNTVDNNPDTSAQDEHNRKMEEKFEQSQNISENNQSKPDGVVQRPDDIPEKFWDSETGTLRTEDLLKSYREMESKMSSGNEADDNDDAGVEGNDEGNDSGNEGGLNYDRFTEEFLSEGDLSDESYKALEEAGIPKEMVEEYLDGQRAIAQVRENAAFTEAGGEDNFRTMQEWARSNLSAEDIAAFDEAVVGSHADMLQAVKELRSIYTEANGSEPSLQTGQNGAASPQGYESMAQMKADMKDPRYKTDPAFRKQVEQKLARSPHLF